MGQRALSRQHSPKCDGTNPKGLPDPSGFWRTPITRYDVAHQFVHRDDLRPDGSQIKTPPMSFADHNDALNYAIRDLRLNSRLYIERYLQWKS